MSILEARLADAASMIDLTLSLVTGLKKIGRKIVTYYIIATYTLKHVDTFPLLVLKGPMGTGKSECEKVASAFSFRPHSFSLQGMTLPVIRDELDECHIGTAVIEEGDHAWRLDEEVERLLLGRYQRATAQAGLKEKEGDRYETSLKFYFGATVLHRRLPFSDPALDGRSVTVSFRRDLSRTYEEFHDDDPWVKEGLELLKGLELEPVEFTPLPGVAPRIFNTYKPLLGAARLCGDDTFPEEIRERLLIDTAELIEGQSVEPDVLVLRALIEALTIKGERLDFHNVRFGTLANFIWIDHRVSLSPRQIGAILRRQFGFRCRTSHGVTVVAPTPVKLVKACEESGYEDEAITSLKYEVLK